LIAKGELKPDSFMRGIEEMARSLVMENAAPVEEHKNLFGSQKESIGICPRCGGNVLESKKNFHCENRDCQFVMWKSDRFFTSRKKELTKPIASRTAEIGESGGQGLVFREKG